MTYQTGREFLVRQRAAWQEDVGDQALDGGTRLSHRVSRVYEVSEVYEVNQSHLPPAHLLASQQVINSCPQCFTHLRGSVMVLLFMV